MSETTVELKPATAEVHTIDSYEAFHSTLVAQSELIPEIAEGAEELTEAGNELIEAFEIEPEFFDDRSRAMIFTSLAEHHLKNEQKKDIPSEYKKKKEFIADAVFVLTEGYSHLYAAVRQDDRRLAENNQIGLSPEGEKALFDRFTDQAASEALQQKLLEDGIYSDVYDKLGVQFDGTVVLPEVKVLSIGNIFDHVEFDREANGIEWHEADAWGKGLQKRKDALAASHIDGDLIAASSGFAVTILGKEYIYLPQIKSELYSADQDNVVPREDIEKSKRKVIGLIQHETIHCVENVRVGSFGWSLEERRAEYFSGDTTEYFDVKKYFNEIQIASGSKHVFELFDEQAEARKEGKDLNIYELIAREYGIAAVTDIATIRPKIYVQTEKSPLKKEMLEYAGTFDDAVTDFTHSLSPEAREQGRIRLEDRKNKILKGREEDASYVDYIENYFKNLKQALDTNKG